MSIPEALVYVATSTGALSAVAGAVTASTTLRSVRRANQPLVYGEMAFDRVPGPWRNEEERDNAPIRGVFVYLYNDGPATALEVRCNLRSTSGSWRMDWSDPVRAIRPGESMPTEGGFRFPSPWTTFMNVDNEPWGVATRFQDSTGRTWESYNQRWPTAPLMTRRVHGADPHSTLRRPEAPTGT